MKMVERYILLILGLMLPLITVSVIFAARADSIINPGLSSVDTRPYGLTFAQWSEKWWRWFVSIPQPENPGNDNTGKYCAIDQNDPHVWFLTGAGSGTFIRSCTIPGNSLSTCGK